jgi:glycine oxidase
MGGGLIGLSCILHLLDACPDLRITLIDAPTNPGIASRAAAGMLAPYAEFEADSPLFRRCRESLEYYPAFLHKFCQDGPKMNSAGVLIPASGLSQARSERIASFAANYADIQHLGEDDLRKVEPMLVGGECREAIKLPGAIVNPRHLLDALKQAAFRRGVTAVAGVASHVVCDDGSPRHIESVELEDGTHLYPENVLLASGAWSKRLAQIFGVDLPMIPVKGQVARIAAPDGFLRHIIHEHAIYLAPRPGEGIIIGATVEEAGFDDAVSAEVNEELLRAACVYTPSLADYPIVESWTGFRPRLPDGNPVIDWSNEVDNLLLATGHFRNGVLLTPLTGKLIAERFLSA